MSKSPNTLVTLLESLSDVTVTLIADFPATGGGVAVAIGLAELGVTVFPVGVVGEDEFGHQILQALHGHRISTAGINKLKNYVTPNDAAGELLHGEHPVLLNLIEHARKFVSASEAMLVCDCGIGAASPRVLNFIKSNGCVREKILAARSRERLAEFEQLTTAIASESELEKAIGVEIDGDAKKSAVAGEGFVQEMKLESFIALGNEKLLVFSGSQKPQSIVLATAASAEDIDLIGAIFAAGCAAGAEGSDAAQLAVQVTGFLKSRPAAGKRGRREELLAHLSAPKAAGRSR